MVMGPLLVLGFLLFARDLGLRRNLRLLIAAGIAMAWIFIDWLAFQTLCLRNAHRGGLAKPGGDRQAALLATVRSILNDYWLLSIAPFTQRISITGFSDAMAHA